MGMNSSRFRFNATCISYLFFTMLVFQVNSCAYLHNRILLKPSKHFIAKYIFMIAYAHICAARGSYFSQSFFYIVQCGKRNGAEKDTREKTEIKKFE